MTGPAHPWRHSGVGPEVHVGIYRTGEHATATGGRAAAQPSGNLTSLWVEADGVEVDLESVDVRHPSTVAGVAGATLRG